MDSGCLGNHMLLPVPATTGVGPGGDTGEGVSLSRANRIYSKKEFICVCPANVKRYLYVWYGCPEMYII